MRKLSILLASFLILLVSFGLCSAEKIYCKDGQIINGQIIYRSRGSVWLKHGSGSIGIDTQRIDRIENDDGSISKYDYRTLCNMTQGFIRQKNYNRAAEICSILLESFPDNAQIRYLRSGLNYKAGDFKEAIEDYNFLIEHNLADAKIINNLGVIYVNNRDYAKARRLFVRALDQKPDMVEAHNNLAELSLITNDFDNAIDEFKKTVELEPENLNTLFNLGLAYMKSGDYLNAKEQWQKILIIIPGDNDTKNALEYLNLRDNGIQDMNYIDNLE